MATLPSSTLQEIINRMQVDMQNALPESNPYLPNSFLLGLIISNGGRYYENSLQFQSLFNALFLTTTEDQFLSDWGQIFALTQKEATQSSGFVTSTGSIGTPIPVGTILTNSSGSQYSSTSSGLVASVNLDVTLVRIGSTVEATTVLSNNFATGIDVTISGSSDPDYDGTFQIIVLDDVTFTYQISTAPASPDSASAQANIATFSIQSEDFGSDQNLSSGTPINYQSIIVGIDDNVAYPQSAGISGGQDNETNDEFRARLLFRFQNPVAQFSISSIEEQCFLISGVTRVWVQPITPSDGQVTVYFVRDNDAVIIPTASEILDVRNSILVIYPASSDPTDLFVDAPIPVTINFDFSSVSPNTPEMQEAISANLQQFFKDQAGVGDDILQIAYNSTIYNTIDPVTGDQISNFALTSPAGDVNISNDEIGILGDVTF